MKTEKEYMDGQSAIIHYMRAIRIASVDDGDVDYITVKLCGSKLLVGIQQPTARFTPDDPEFAVLIAVAKGVAGRHIEKHKKKLEEVGIDPDSVRKMPTTTGMSVHNPMDQLEAAARKLRKAKEG